MVWLAYLEAYLTNALMRSPIFNRTVHRFHARIARFKTGEPPPGSVGGSNPPDGPAGPDRSLKRFIDIYKEEFRDSEIGRLFRNNNKK